MIDEIKIKHLLFKKIIELKSAYVSKLSSMLDLSIDVCFSYCEEIYYDGYIDFIDVTTYDGKDAIININGKGEIFFQSGGYEKEDYEFKKEKRNYNRQRFLSNLSTFILILTSIATVVLGIFVYLQNNKISELEEQLRLDDKQKIKNELIGKWISCSRIDTAYYVFNEDNTWEFTLSTSETKRTYKGEYQIGVEKGVFLRRFGSQHWGHDTTYVDIKSGIGTSYLYIENDFLINNHEDYENKYRKVK